MFCSKCGSEISDSSKFCPKCGEKIPGKGVNLNIPSNIDITKISSGAQGIISNIKEGVTSNSGIIGENKAIYFSGGLFFLLQFMFFFFPAIKIEVLIAKTSFGIFDLWEEADITVFGFVKAFMIILFIVSALSYFAPVVLKKQNAEKFFILPIVTSVISFLIYIVTLIIVYIGTSDTGLGDMSDYISLKAGAWFYIISFLVSVAASVIMKKRTGNSPTYSDIGQNNA